MSNDILLSGRHRVRRVASPAPGRKARDGARLLGAWGSLIRLLMAAVLLAAASAVWAGTLGAVAVAPNSITAGTPTALLVTATITDPQYIAGSANLQRLKADGTVQSVLGLLHDDGRDGDAVAGDKIYSLRTTLSEAAAGTVRLQVSAGFRGELRRTFSPAMAVTVNGNGGTGTIGAVGIVPGFTPAGVAAIATATAVITSEGLVPGSVMLQKLDPGGRVLATLGPMHDDGVNGDARAGDKTFSLRTTILENTPGDLAFRVIAQFQGQSQPVLSAGMTVAITGTATGVEIASPATGAYLNTPVITVSGRTGDTAAQVSVNGIATPVSNGAFSTSVPLNEGPNTVTAVATNRNGTTSTRSIQVTLDTTAPHVQIYSPAAGGSTGAATVTVTGLVNDIVVGTVNPQQATVTVNGIAATVVNRSFQANNVPLSVGANTLQAVTTDRAGNRATATVQVQRVPADQGGLSIVSGNNQTAPVGIGLAEPLVVKLVNNLGLPVARRPVVFRVLGLDGGLSMVAGPGAGMSAVAVNTDAQGLARAWLRLGSRAGAGNNLAQASAAGVAATADFTASGTAGAPGLIVVDSGNNQTGVVGQPLPLPFIAIVTDAKYNRLPGVPVTFAVRSGGGSFAGSPTLQAVSDSDGRIAATLTLGPDQGVNNNVVEASFATNTGFPAAFTVTGLVPGPADQTRISGVVLDNSNLPIAGVTMRLLNITQGNFSNIPQQVATPVRTDAQGQFVMTGVPVGIFKLMADGGTATRPGTWPTLDFDMITVSGQNNTIGMPVFLPEINPNNRLCVNDTTGGVLTLAEVPGFALNIGAGSATFPGGSKTGCVSVTPVNMDKSPMSPGFGQQPRFLVTIQPAGTHFNPPARMTIPNVDGLAPRSVTEMYSYDHDLASFVAIGSATVSEDGSTITSDAGSGVIKAGWHCGGDPNTTGSAGTCPFCQKCQGASCVTDASKDKAPVPGDACKACQNGSPAAVDITNVVAKVEGQAEAWKLLGSGGATFAFTGTATSALCSTLVYKWEFGDGGTATGAAVSHTYTTNGDRTATLMVSCSTCPDEKTATAKVTVLELKHETFVTTPADRNRTKIGVGEEVNFTVTPAKTVDWTVTGGGTLSAASGSTTMFTAGKVAATPTVRFTKAPFIDESTALTVIEPNALAMVKLREDAYPAGTQGVGMFLQINIRPADVSFYRIEWQEQPGPATNVTGYFVPYHVGDALKHNPANIWCGFGQNNVSVCEDHAAQSGYPPPWTAGNFDWVIPNNFQIVGETPGGSFGNGKLFTNTLQRRFIEGPPNAGRTTMQKAGATATRAP